MQVLVVFAAVLAMGMAATYSQTQTKCLYDNYQQLFTNIRAQTEYSDYFGCNTDNPDQTECPLVKTLWQDMQQAIALWNTIKDNPSDPNLAQTIYDLTQLVKQVQTDNQAIWDAATPDQQNGVQATYNRVKTRISTALVCIN